MDSLLVYTFCLVLTLVINLLLTPKIGVFARMISCLSVITVTCFTLKRSRMSSKTVFPSEAYTVKTAIGVGSVLAGVILLSVPALLLFHIVAPDFAITGFHVLDQSPEPGKYFWTAALIILSAIANTVLFDGYLYTNFKNPQKPFVQVLFCSVTYTLFFADIYLLIPLAIVEGGICYVRAKTENIKLSFIMQLFASSGAYGVLQFSSKSSTFFGENEGAAKIIGMAMIFLGVSMLLLWLSTSMLDKKSRLTSLGKLLTVVLFIIFLAIGSGLASL